MLLFQDVSIINKHLRPFSTLRCLQQAKIFSLQFSSNVGFTVWHLGIPNYILVSSLCFPHLCPVSLCYIIVPFQQSTPCVLYSILLPVFTCELSVNICIVFCYNYLLATYILQLFFFVFTCSSYTSLQISVISVISVFENNLFLCFL